MERTRTGATSRRQLIFGILSAVAVLPAIVEGGGFRHSPGTVDALRVASLLFVGLFVLEVVVARISADDGRAFLEEYGLDLAFLLLLGTVVLLLVLLGGASFRGVVAVARIYLLLNVLLRMLRLLKFAARKRFHYARAFGLSFVAIILVGTLLLWLLPGAKAEGKELGFTDALFTATSATCVTGLITVDTGTQFSRFGQSVILVLFQIGGLGLMTFAAFFAIALGQGLGFRDREVMKGVLNLEVVGRIGRVIVGILVLTVVIEAISAAVLYDRWHGVEDPSDRLFYSVFHAVSAFCNAGFSLESTSLMGYVSDPVVNWTVMLEIVIGGLGFGVVIELLGRGGGWFRRVVGRRPAREDRRRLSVQTRIVLISSTVLLLGGMLLFLLFEAKNPETLGPLTPAEKIQAAMFQSVTSRTAGFNTVPIDGMTDAGQFLTLVLMLIGASPGSTGGGIKTVTAVVLLLSVITLLRNRPRVEAARRTLPPATVRKATVIVVTAIAVVTVATLVLVAVERGRFPFLSIFFEVGSAFGTVGLSTGITGGLGPVSKLVLCVVMLVGRIGPLSLVIALSQTKTVRGAELPEEHVMIG